jgi:coproporphyrinogen III oxidase-like Fe-S oxidoreductase
LTGLRTKKGICCETVKTLFPDFFFSFEQHKKIYLARELLQEQNGNISLTRKGIMLSDAIMSDFFVTE